jgi:hypothetical protein
MYTLTARTSTQNLQEKYQEDRIRSFVPNRDKLILKINFHYPHWHSYMVLVYPAHHAKNRTGSEQDLERWNQCESSCQHSTPQFVFYVLDLSFPATNRQPKANKKKEELLVCQLRMTDWLFTLLNLKPMKASVLVLMIRNYKRCERKSDAGYIVIDTVSWRL